jgi:hypothetical protein
MRCKKELVRNLDQFFLADRNANMGLGIHLDIENFFSNFWTSISRGELIALCIFYFLLVGIEDTNIFHGKNLKNLLPFFLGKSKCGLGVGLGCGWGQFFDLFLNPQLWGSNGWILACFFFMDRYLS